MNDTHITQVFDDELARLVQLVTEMAGKCEWQMMTAMQTLSKHDANAAQQVVDAHAEFSGWAKKQLQSVDDNQLASLAARLGAAHKRLRLLDEYEQNLVQKLRQNVDKKQKVWSIPRLDEEVHNLQALRKVGDLLFYSSS